MSQLLPSPEFKMPSRSESLFAGALTIMAMAGCAVQSPRWVEKPWTPASYQASDSRKKENQPEETEPESPTVRQTGFQEPETGNGTSPSGESTVVRGQDSGIPPSGQQGSWAPPGQTYFVPPGQGSTTQYQQVYQVPSGGTNAPQIGNPNEIPPYLQQNGATGGYTDPYNYADIDVMLREAKTGKMTVGAAYNSNSGLVGQIIIDERNFDIMNYPRSIEDIVNGTAWRGAGQGFRLELVPGSEVQRYAVNFDEPYLFNSLISFSASGYFFDRQYFDWSEQRLGGRLGLGYRLTPDLSLTVGMRMENVNIRDPRVNTSPSLNAVVGDNALYLGSVSLINDTRDHPFMASDGSYLELSFSQGFGDFSYPRADIDYRRYFLLYQRPDLSGRHTLSFQTRVGYSGADTPIFENYQVGGFSSLRGFAFRGASPIEGGVRAGGKFQWLNTVEYLFPLSADDMFKGVVFCDFGTVEPDVSLKAENFRVAPGLGLRIHMPVGGAGGAPLAFDFAFPVAMADTDDKQIFSFYMGILR
jgi:outer membrane protein insertion porin family